MKIGVFGLWHLGCTILASWAKLGDQIVGYDYDYLTIEKLNQIIVEPKIDINLTKEALACEDLGHQFKNSLTKRYELGDEDNQFSFYHT